MTITFTFAWWHIPAAITAIVFIWWLLPKDRSGGVFGELDSLFGVLAGLLVILAAWAIAGAIK